MFARTLTCNDCGWRTVCGADDVATRLRLVGHLRRDAAPGEGLLAALLDESAGMMTCPTCKRVGLVVGDASLDVEADDWQAAVLCDGCRKPIDPERLEVFPGTKRCVACQAKRESGEDDSEPEFCKRCGSLLELRVSRGGGITRYRLFCTGDPPCRV
ncbi:MAG: TraR/DksA family transcriptional regulator [Lacipirellulaceae bacterium]